MKTTAAVILAGMAGALIVLGVTSPEARSYTPAPSTTAPPSATGPFLRFEHELWNFGTVREGEIVDHVFPFRNEGNETLIITEVRASCGCTRSGALSKEVGPGETGGIFVVFDSSGKWGRITKSVFVTSNADDSGERVPGSRRVPRPRRVLTIDINVLSDTTTLAPAGTAGGAVRIMALVDRGAGRSIFDTACGSCHVEPARDQFGEALYDVACGMCHGNVYHPAVDSAAAMTGSRYLTNRTREYLRTITARGTRNPMMPGFAVEHGGPLTGPQIDSLMDYFDRIRPNVPIHELPRFGH